MPDILGRVIGGVKNVTNKETLPNLLIDNWQYALQEKTALASGGAGGHHGGAGGHHKQEGITVGMEMMETVAMETTNPSLGHRIQWTSMMVLSS